MCFQDDCEIKGCSRQKERDGLQLISFLWGGAVKFLYKESGTSKIDQSCCYVEDCQFQLPFLREISILEILIMRNIFRGVFLFLQLAWIREDEESAVAQHQLPARSRNG